VTYACSSFCEIVQIALFELSSFIFSDFASNSTFSTKWLLVVSLMLGFQPEADLHFLRFVVDYDVGFLSWSCVLAL
jgi:hypothetical protein